MNFIRTGVKLTFDNFEKQTLKNALEVLQKCGWQMEDNLTMGERNNYEKLEKDINNAYWAVDTLLDTIGDIEVDQAE